MSDVARSALAGDGLIDGPIHHITTRTFSVPITRLQRRSGRYFDGKLEWDLTRLWPWQRRLWISRVTGSVLCTGKGCKLCRTSGLYGGKYVTVLCSLWRSHGIYLGGHIWRLVVRVGLFWHRPLGFDIAVYRVEPYRTYIAWRR